MEEKAVKIIVTDGCEACDIIKKKNLDDVELINITDPRAIDLIGKKEGDVIVPQAFDEQNKMCKISFSEDSVVVECEHKKVILVEDASIVVPEDKEEEIATQLESEESET